MEAQTPEGVSVAVATDATAAEIAAKALADYPNHQFTGKVLHVGDPDEVGPGLQEVVFEVES